MLGPYRLTWLYNEPTMSSPPSYLTRSATENRSARPAYTTRSFTENTTTRPAYHTRTSTEDLSSRLIHYALPTEDVYSRSSSPTLALHYDHSITIERYQAARRSLPDHETTSHLRAAHSELCKAVRTKPYIHLFDELLAKLRAMPTSAEIDELKEIGRTRVVKDGSSRSARQLRQEIQAMNVAVEMRQEVGTREGWQELTVQARNAVVAMSRF